MVVQLINSKTNRAVANQIIEINKNKTCFYSYNTLIATKEDNNIILTGAWDYSKTTLKYLCEFLWQVTNLKFNKAGIQKALKERVYKDYIFTLA